MTPMTNDEKHLNTLATCFTVFGWLVGIFMSFPLIHVTVGILMVSGVMGPGSETRSDASETTLVHEMRMDSVVQLDEEETSVPNETAVETVRAEPAEPDDSEERLLAGVGLMFICMGSIFVLGGWAWAILLLVTARKLRARKNRMFCCVIAGITCASVPLGTVLGVFTLVVLMRPSVQALFAGLPPEMLTPAAPPMPPVPPAPSA